MYSQELNIKLHALKCFFKRVYINIKSMSVPIKLYTYMKIFTSVEQVNMNISFFSFIFSVFIQLLLSCNRKRRKMFHLNQLTLTVYSKSIYISCGATRYSFSLMIKFKIYASQVEVFASSMKLKLIFFSVMENFCRACERDEAFVYMEFVRSRIN